MKKNIFLSCIISFFASAVFSQRVIEVKYALDPKGNYQFSCTNNAFCNYILEISFTSLDNAKADHELPYRNVVKPGNNKLFTISKENAGNPIQFKYSVAYHKGCINPKVDTNFVYLLPIAPGKEAQVYEMSGSGSGGGPSASDASPQTTQEFRGWYVIRLRMKPGDTIFAARRGIVTEIHAESGLNDSGRVSIGNENYLEICHADCSFGHYGILKKNGALVKPGQIVEAGQPIALVGGDKFGRGSDGKFSVYYNVDDDETNEGTMKKIYWAYVPLQFWTKTNGKGKLKHGATYTSEHPKAIITQEIKKPKAKKKNG